MPSSNITFVFNPNSTARTEQLNVNFADIVKYINDRNDGSVGWDAVTIGTDSTTTGVLKFFNSTNSNTVSFQPGVTSSTITYTLPLAGPASNDYLLASSTGGTLSWLNAAGTFSPIGSAYVTIGNDGTLTAERSLSGTTNQVTVTDNGANSTVVLSTPQDIHTSASPTFDDLTLTGNIDLEGSVEVGESSPAQITSDQNDYSPGDFTVLRLTSDASRTITGLSSGAAGRILYLINVGSNNIVLANQSASSTAANRIITGTGANLTVVADDVVKLYYDNTTARWRTTNFSNALWG